MDYIRFPIVVRNVCIYTWPSKLIALETFFIDIKGHLNKKIKLELLEDKTPEKKKNT